MTQPEPPPAQAQFDTAPAPIDHLRRYTPEEVSANGWLPWTARNIRNKAYKHEIYCHKDGGKITFTVEDILRTNALSAVEPFVQPKPARAAA